MNIELRGIDGPNIYKVHVCSFCRMIVGSAEYVCHCQPRPCEVCKETIDSRSYCGTCESTRRAAAEAKRFEAAKKIPESEYVGWVVCDEISGSRDGYFEDMDELRDRAETNEQTLPTYVWATTTERTHLDADRILEGAMEDAPEDSHVSKSARAELQKFLDNWTARHSPIWFMPDYTTAVTLSEVPPT